MKLEYDKPASKIRRRHSLFNAARGIDRDADIFQQASLPIGCGDLGAAIFGETDCERLIVNEKTLWLGGPVNGGDYNGGNVEGPDEKGNTQSDYYYATREFLLAGNTEEAERVFENIFGDVSVKGKYQCLGELRLEFGHARVKRYRRELDLDSAAVRVGYENEGCAYSREYFASNPAKVIACEFTADGANLDFKINFSALKGSISANDDGIIVKTGKLKNGLNFCAALAADACGGSVVSDGSSLRVWGTARACVYFTAATDYDDAFPVYRTGESSEDLLKRVRETAVAAKKTGYRRLKEAHTADYGELFGRVGLDLGGVKPSFTTDKLVARARAGLLRKTEKRYLEQLLFDYGRYLLVSCSRADSKLPANLQGLWCANDSPPWDCDYHLNINLQMNYWPAYNANLAECAAPLTKYVDALRRPGRITAKVYTATPEELAAGIPEAAYGFVVHTESTPYGYTAPGAGKYRKAMWSPEAAAWLAQSLYDGYEYSLDISYLKSIYPIMKEAALYFERTLADDGRGGLVSAPSYSPEHGPLSAGTTYGQTLIRQLMCDCIKAAAALGDNSKTALWSSVKDRLDPVRVGVSGQLAEWRHEDRTGSEGEKKHRHISHLLGLFPGNLIDKDAHPEWLRAAAVSLRSRGRYATGWAMGQRVNAWARAGDGEEALKTVGRLMRRGIYKNLWSAHPPFQIDGNFGYTAGVAEMLAQSKLGYIEILPALPSDWPNGRFEGLVARGNFTLSAEWKDRALTRLEIFSGSGGECVLKLGSEDFKVTDDAGCSLPFSVKSGRLAFSAEAGRGYVLSKPRPNMLR